MTSAMIKFHPKSRRKFRFNEMILLPYVLIFEPFAANNGFDDGANFRLKNEIGMIDKSAPVSMRNFKFVFLSVMNRRLDFRF